MSAQHDPCTCRVCIAQRKRIAAELDEIKTKLDSIEEHAAFWIRADQRFNKGQRVELSRKALKGNLIPKTRQDRKGTILRIENGFTVVVQWDGYKGPRYWHHSFVNPVSGLKLF